MIVKLFGILHRVIVGQEMMSTAAVCSSHSDLKSSSCHAICEQFRHASGRWHVHLELCSFYDDPHL